MAGDRTKRLGKFLLLAALGLVLAAGAAVVVKHKKAELSEKPAPGIRPTAVRTAVAEHGQMPIRDHYIGIIEPELAADLSVRANGHVNSIAADVGDRLRKGQTAAVVDPQIPRREKRAIAEELKGAEEALAISKKILKRRKTLVRDKHVSEENLDQARRQYVLDRARVKRLGQELAAKEKAFAYTRLTAPFDGIITERMKDPGDLVSPGVPVLRLENPDAGYKILAKVPQATAGRLTPGCPVLLSFHGKEKSAAIDRVHPAVSAGALAVVEIRSREKPFGLPSGSALGVDLTLSRPEGLIIPLGCLLEQQSAYRVFVIDEDETTVRSVSVSLLGKSGGRAVVEGDIADGARLVSGSESMLLQLTDGAPVNPVAQSSSAPEGP
ncbi:MAG: efflux RND transporter periplasmic adaptor subunit [Desulfosalsimonadaceae bacterium]